MQKVSNIKPLLVKSLLIQHEATLSMASSELTKFGIAALRKTLNAGEMRWRSLERPGQSQKMARVRIHLVAAQLGDTNDAYCRDCQMALLMSELTYLKLQFQLNRPT